MKDWIILREALDCLTEASLDETKGICVVGGSCIGKDKDGKTVCIPIDFNSNGLKTDTAAQADITQDAGVSACPQTIVLGHNDWNSSTLRLNFRESTSRTQPPTECLVCPEIKSCAGGAGAGSGTPRMSLCATTAQLKDL